jgi:hypothetical protein
MFMFSGMLRDLVEITLIPGMVDYFKNLAQELEVFCFG